MNTSTTMSVTTDRRWILFAAVTGLLCLAAYFSRFLSLPSEWAIVGYFFFGPLLALFSLGLYHRLKDEGAAPATQSFLICNILAGVSVANMFVVQSLNSHHWGRMLGRDSQPFSREEVREIMEAVFTAQAGIGMVWDIFIFLGSLFLAYVLIRKTGLFFKAVGAAGFLLSIAGLALNFYAWPDVNPKTIGLVDVGPFMGGWYGVVIGWLVYEAVKYRNAPVSDRSS